MNHSSFLFASRGMLKIRSSYSFFFAKCHPVALFNLTATDILSLFQVMVTEDMLKASFKATYSELLSETARPGTSGIVRPKMKKNVTGAIAERTIQAVAVEKKEEEAPFEDVPLGLYNENYENMASLKRKPIQQGDAGKGGPFKNTKHRQKISQDVVPSTSKPPIPPPPPLPDRIPDKTTSADGIKASTLQSRRSTLKHVDPKDAKLLTAMDETVNSMSASLDRMVDIMGSALTQRRRALGGPTSSHSGSSPLHWTDDEDEEQQSKL